MNILVQYTGLVAAEIEGRNIPAKWKYINNISNILKLQLSV